MIERAVRGVELGLQEYAAVSYCFQRGWAFIGETKANEELEEKSECYFVIMVINLSPDQLL